MASFRFDDFLKLSNWSRISTKRKSKSDTWTSTSVNVILKCVFECLQIFFHLMYERQFKATKKSSWNAIEMVRFFSFLLFYSHITVKKTKQQKRILRTTVWTAQQKRRTPSNELFSIKRVSIAVKWKNRHWLVVLCVGQKKSDSFIWSV